LATICGKGDNDVFILEEPAGDNAMAQILYCFGSVVVFVVYGNSGSLYDSEELLGED